MWIESIIFGTNFINLQQGKTPVSASHACQRTPPPRGRSVGLALSRAADSRAWSTEPAASARVGIETKLPGASPSPPCEEVELCTGLTSQIVTILRLDGVHMQNLCCAVSGMLTPGNIACGICQSREPSLSASVPSSFHFLLRICPLRICPLVPVFRFISRCAPGATTFSLAGFSPAFAAAAAAAELRVLRAFFSCFSHLPSPAPPSFSSASLACFAPLASSLAGGYPCLLW